MFDIDKSINSILGNKKKKGKNSNFGFNMNIDNMFKTVSPIKSKGASPVMQQTWKKFSPAKKQILRRKLHDTDRDRVPDRFDCQPFNPVMQDSSISQNNPLYFHDDIEVEDVKSKKEFIVKAGTKGNYVKDINQGEYQDSIIVRLNNGKLVYAFPADVEFI